MSANITLAPGFQRRRAVAAQEYKPICLSLTGMAKRPPHVALAAQPISRCQAADEVWRIAFSHAWQVTLYMDDAAAKEPKVNKL